MMGDPFSLYFKRTDITPPAKPKLVTPHSSPCPPSPGRSKADRHARRLGRSPQGRDQGSPVRKPALKVRGGR